MGYDLLKKTYLAHQTENEVGLITDSTAENRILSEKANGIALYSAPLKTPSKAARIKDR